MIKDKLMVGNWIDFEGKLIQVTDVLCDSVNTTEHQALPYDMIGGVVLTPDILEKCPDVVWKHGNEFFIGKLKFTYEKNELSEFVRFHYSGKIRYLQYLHELQNIVQILTQTELTITL